ncbi:MAG TPA: TolC family protein [Chthonomonadaceae bacterium]|nr:TolC family protein [Chthonomonadaceae bacterium]
MSCCVQRVSVLVILLFTSLPMLSGPAQGQGQSETQGRAATAAQSQAQGITPGLGQDVPLPPLPPEVPPAERMTLVQAVDFGLKHSPQILASHYNAEGARANYVGQRSPANPTFNYSGLNNSVTSFDFANRANYSLYLPVETSGKLYWRSRQAQNQWRQSQADAQTTGLSVRQSVANAYIALQVANRGLQDEQEAYDTARRLRDLTLKQFQEGAVPQTNAIRAQVALTQEAGNLFQAITAVSEARAALNVQMGRDASTPIDAVESLAYTPIHPSLQALQTQALKSRPELISAEYTRQALAANVGLQRAAFYPDLLFGTDLQALGDSIWSVGFTIPLDLGSIRGAVTQAQKSVKAQEAQQVQLRQSVQLDVQSAYDALTLAERTVEAYQSGVLPQSESLFQRIQQGYVLGGNTILDLIDAQNTLRTVRIAYYAAIGQYRQALAQMEHATGHPLPELSGNAVTPATTPIK